MKASLGKYILGIDPGQTGAFALYDPFTRKLGKVWDMPAKFNSKDKLEIDCVALANAIGIYAHMIKYAVVENVHSMPGQGVASTFKFGVSKGIILGALGAFNIQAVLVAPAVWKGQMNLTSDKKLSLDRAKKLFPDMARHFSRVKDADRAEAALMAYFVAHMVHRG